ncbi:hypothetical protein [Vulgatibacter sp.]|uniref:hypothetical protein n=1 Tax=Vulgatibacter sp. TaxID=1971226 RepID=UPI00356323FC
MDTGFWTRLHGKLRHAALALGPEAIEALAADANRALELGSLAEPPKGGAKRTERRNRAVRRERS